MVHFPPTRTIQALFLGALASCSFSPPGEPMGVIAPEINSTLTGPVVVLAPDDILAVRFPRSPDWDQERITIGVDGRATFLSLDDIQAAGMTLAALDEKLTEEYAKVLAQPELTVQVVEAAPRKVVIMGEVGASGSYELPAGHLSLLEAFGTASGVIRDSAKLGHTMLMRWMPEEGRVRTWKIDARREEWGAEIPIFLQAHDVVFIPAKPVVHVNEWLDRYIRRNIPTPFLFRPN
ncbi:MAG: hypothetical protein GY711_29470 [bacterium]|nr:hypothetical protein [bacterium]